MTELPPPPPQVALAKEESRFPCENCGADYRFDPASGKNICPHCGHEHTLVTSSPWTTNI
ncbi:MAG: TFIIB-type zinc finger domain-containing protein, partial [Paracoccaceae bacterium]